MKTVRSRRERLLILLAVSLPIALLGLELQREMSFPGFHGNDMNSHLRYIRLFAEAMDRGSLGLDDWDGKANLGSANFRTYQHLAHFVPAAVCHLLGSKNYSRALHTTLVIALCLSIASFFFAARLMGLSPWLAVAAAWLSSLVYSQSGLGHELQAYIYYGWGMYTQAVAAPFFVISLALAFRLSGWVPGAEPSSWKSGIEFGVWTALTFLLHHFYGYMTLQTLLFFGLAGMALRFVSPRRLIPAIAASGIVFTVICAYQLLSIAQDAPLMHQTPWYNARRWDGWGLQTVFQAFVHGALFDWSHWPVVSALLAVGIVASLRPRSARMEKGLVAFFAIGALFLCGRPTLGRVLDFFPGIENVNLERYLSWVHLAGIFLAATGLVTLFGLLRSGVSRLFGPRWALVAAFVLGVVPPLGYLCRGVHGYLARNRLHMVEQIEGQKQLDPKLLTSIASELARGNFWSGTSRHKDRIISVMSVFLGSVVAELGYAQISVPTHTMTYGADTLYKFDPYRLSHYRLFNVTGMILPLHTIVIPKFVQKVYTSGEVASFRAPGIGYWDVIGVSSGPHSASPDQFMEDVYHWLKGPEPDRNIYSAVVPQKVIDRLPQAVPRPSPPGDGEWGRIVSSTSLEHGESNATLEAFRPGSYGLLRTGYHPRWRILVNGRPVTPRFVAPSFVAFELPMGKSEVRAEFPPDPVRSALFLVSLMSLAFGFVVLYARPLRMRFRGVALGPATAQPA